MTVHVNAARRLHLGGGVTVALPTSGLPPGDRLLQISAAGVVSYVADSGGAFGADAQTQITPSTSIVLDEATGNEVAFDLSYTVNKATSGDDTGLKFDKTDTSSPGTSLLVHLLCDGSDVLTLSDLGLLEVPGGTVRAGSVRGEVGQILYLGGNGATHWSIDATGNIGVVAHDSYTFGSFSGCASEIYAADLVLWNQTTPTAQTLYGTRTDASNYERLRIYAQTADDFRIDTEAAGTGTVRGIATNAEWTFDDDIILSWASKIKDPVYSGNHLDLNYFNGVTQLSGNNAIHLNAGSHKITVNSDGNLYAPMTIVQDMGTDDQAYINFEATADADATSAISTLTTSGATTHHVQVEINGTKAWIAVSTTDPT